MPIVWPGDIVSWSHALRVDVPATPFEEINWAPRQEVMENAVAALQLVASKPVASAATFMDPGPKYPSFLRRAAMVGGMLFGPALFAQHRPVGALGEPPERLVEVFENYARRTDEKALELAMRRLAGAFIRSDDEDRIIDYWVALEALFLPESQELSYRASVRLAHFIGNDGRSRERVYALVRDSYALRSAVVHGIAEGVGQRKKLDLGDLTTRTHGLLRQAIIGWLGPSVDHSREALDRAVIGAENGEP